MTIRAGRAACKSSRAKENSDRVQNMKGRAQHPRNTVLVCILFASYPRTSLVCWQYTTMSQLNITKPAPEWKGMAVVNGDMKQIALSNYKGKYVVFFFYPLDLYVPPFSSHSSGS